MPAPLGATLVAGGVSFAVVAPNAGAVYVCLFDGNDRETARFRLPTRHGDIHCGFLSGASAGCRYGLRAEGPWAPEAGHRYDAAKLLVDPYATRLDRPFAWNPSLAVRGAESAHLVPKAIVETQAPAVSPSAPRPLGFVYELPVRAYTIRHPDVPDKLRGTVAALAEPCIVEHLARLGVDTVELMPLWAWIDERHLPALGLANAWGYNPVSLLAPDPRLAPGGMAEIRATVAKLHEAGLRVVLDVVVNHSGESDTHGATLSLRGLDNALYYARGTDGTLVNDTGCGNTLALEHAPVVRLAMDALRHWAAAGFDGFRFDLAAVLGRTGQGFDPQSPLLAAIAQDPVLSRLSLIAEPWAAPVRAAPRLPGTGGTPAPATAPAASGAAMRTPWETSPPRSAARRTCSAAAIAARPPASTCSPRTTASRSATWCTTPRSATRRTRRAPATVIPARCRGSAPRRMPTSAPCWLR